MTASDFTCVLDAKATLGECPVWSTREQVLYYVDIPGRRLQRYDPASGDLCHWAFETDVACLAPRLDDLLAS